MRRAGRAPANLAERLPTRHDPLATRAAGGKAMQALTALVPTMVGGAADLVESTKTRSTARTAYRGPRPGATCTGACASTRWAAGQRTGAARRHRRPYGATFLVFADYMRPAIRLSALIGLPVVWVFTHDSIGVGEDGPTHQPVEHLAALRAIPNLVVIRPADAAETAQAWGVALGRRDGPVCLILTRQAVPALDRDALAGAEGLRRGPTCWPRRVTDARGRARSSGSEVALALEARDALAAEGIAARVVSMPSWELFDAQPSEYREAVLPAALPVVSVEAGVEQGWSRYADASVSVDRFGASAPGPEVFRGLGVTGEAAAAAVRALIRSRRSG